MEVQERINILKQHGRIPSGVNVPVFGTIDSILKARIEQEYYKFEYDGTGFFPGRDIEINPVLSTPEYRRGYCGFKYTIAKILKPILLIEIGVGAGNSALAFANGYPKLNYLGIDNHSKASTDEFDYPSWVEIEMDKLKINAQFMKADSKKLSEIPTADLVHVDGNHEYEYAKSDVTLALKSRARFILVDDAFDPAVMEATFSALRENGGGYRWIFFEDTFTGNLLLVRS